MKTYSRFLIVWFINFLIVYYANSLYPMYYALGNAGLSLIKAAIFSAFLLTLAGRIAKTVLPSWGIKTKGRYQKFLLYWLTNSAAIWLIARFSFVTGFGIRAYYYALVLGFIACLAQWLLRQVFKYAKIIEK